MRSHLFFAVHPDTVPVNLKGYRVSVGLFRNRERGQSNLERVSVQTLNLADQIVRNNEWLDLEFALIRHVKEICVPTGSDHFGLVRTRNSNQELIA
ncbi:hypothetical protein DDZ18_11165 [Marinicauda salina]|uniref:Uncharacterized protein n=1 Tax=Marinicauda salina TaxID=2135793 RepID=A0A2U2BRY9_9PROT|nr:hypothetical protein DDZ18_11165 [Marinicauda salina]